MYHVYLTNYCCYTFLIFFHCVYKEIVGFHDIFFLSFSFIFFILLEDVEFLDIVTNCAFNALQH